jgi:hypothetical protein
MGAGALRFLRFIPALVLVALAVLVALLAADVRGWQRTLAGDDVRAGVTWTASPRLPGDLAGRLLGVGDDIRARRAILLFEQTVSVRARLDNAQDVTAARAQAETELAAIARGRGLRASQAATLLGILAFGDFARAGRQASQADSAIADFESAVRADTGNTVAKFDLELLLRSLAAHGSRTGTNGGAASGGTGRNGAGGGTPGRGY